MSRARPDPFREADLLVWLSDEGARLGPPVPLVWRPPPPIPVEAPWSLAMALQLRRLGESPPPSELSHELLAWLAANPPLLTRWREALAALPEQDQGALICTYLACPALDRSIVAWWVLERGVLRLLPADLDGAAALRWTRARLRLRSGGRAMVGWALLSSVFACGLQGIFGSTRLDATLYSVASLLDPRPLSAPQPDLRVLYVPAVDGDQERTDRGGLALLLSAVLQRQPLVVGLDLLLDVRGPSPEGAAALEEVICRGRDRIVLGEYPDYDGMTGDSHRIEADFRACLDPRDGSCAPLPLGADPIAFPGLWNINEGRHLFQTELRQGEHDVLGAALFRRWCASKAESGCSDEILRWDRPLLFQLPDPRAEGLSLRLPDDARSWTPTQVEQALDTIDLRDRVVLIGSWDPRDDALPVPAMVGLGEGFDPDALPGVMVQGAVFHTLASHGPTWRLADAVERSVGSPWGGALAALGVVTGWASAFGAMVLRAGAGSRAAVLALLAVLVSSWLSLHLLGLWLPTAESITSVGVLWVILTWRRARRVSRASAAIGGEA